MSCQSKLITHNVLNMNCPFKNTISITPPYMCVTQTILNRLNQPKHFYSEGTICIELFQ